MPILTKNFTFKTKKLSFRNNLDEESTKIFVSRYFFFPVQGRLCEVTAKQLKEEYYNDLKIQLTFLEKINLDLNAFYCAFLECCLHHIKKFGRLIMSDLHAKLNATMHIIDETNG